MPKPCLINTRIIDNGECIYMPRGYYKYSKSHSIISYGAFHTKSDIINKPIEFIDDVVNLFDNYISMNRQMEDIIKKYSLFVNSERDEHYVFASIIRLYVNKLLKENNISFIDQDQIIKYALKHTLSSEYETSNDYPEIEANITKITTLNQLVGFILYILYQVDIYSKDEMLQAHYIVSSLPNAPLNGMKVNKNVLKLKNGARLLIKDYDYTKKEKYVMYNRSGDAIFFLIAKSINPELPIHEAIKEGIKYENELLRQMNNYYKSRGNHYIPPTIEINLSLPYIKFIRFYSNGNIDIIFTDETYSNMVYKNAKKLYKKYINYNPKVMI